ncbi:SDR family NAD(P)-dependent oxidoreductase [Limnobacter humi]|uniref:SDR family NAD(P)-dependent oxidoreductase n=1 Tax=Limnobacter humi TaxID=1778671 RepID=A0ABT1WGI4_9BURK|nr:SDR family NAD(P)-dependent oxidoreductase [Limnobacter humi]MCQ8896635.1 SDR family NAD(P)-dependent oxidoreductase [Limnobacter humi]
MFGQKISKQANAVVTGAGSGIGRAFALEVVRRGGQVVVADISLDRAQETVELIRDQVAGKLKNPDLVFVDQAWAVRCDVSKLKDVEALALEAERIFGGTAERSAIDVVVNNAGVGLGGLPVGEIPMEDWTWALGVNLWGVIHGCHVFAPRLKARGRQRRVGIINVASTASFAAAPLMGPYNVTKAGALALSETLAAEMAGTGVNVTALCPTFVKTNITRDGRIAGGSSRFADKLMQWTGVSADAVAKETLDALDKGQLYVLPQLDARMIWRMKRLMPGGYTWGAGVLARVAAKTLS